MPKTALEHLAALLEGNTRFVASTATIQHAELAIRQEPYAVVLGCSDSRVPVEMIFDRGPGEIFVVRVAGNIVHDESLATIEYAVEVLKTPLVIVLGHTGCGAVGAALDYVRNGTIFPGHIGRLVEPIIPAALASRGDHDANWHERAVTTNLLRSVEALQQRSQILMSAVRERRIAIQGAVYDLHTGKVTLVS